MYQDDLIVWILKILVSGKINTAYNVASPLVLALKMQLKK